MYSYCKIETLFGRDILGTKKLIEGEYRNDTFRYLKDSLWRFTEKIDGTNIGVYWDGHKVSFQGRTERADIPKPLTEKLTQMFSGETNEELFEQLFGEKEVVLFGEGYGPKIQKGGGNYRKDVSFILFDVYFPEKNIWANRDTVLELAKSFSIDTVPIIFTGTLNEAVAFVKAKPKSTIGTANMEGLVGLPTIELKDNQGKRVIVKIKTVDFQI